MTGIILAGKDDFYGSAKDYICFFKASAYKGAGDFFTYFCYFGWLLMPLHSQRFNGL